VATSGDHVPALFNNQTTTNASKPVRGHKGETKASKRRQKGVKKESVWGQKGGALGRFFQEQPAPKIIQIIINQTLSLARTNEKFSFCSTPAPATSTIPNKFLKFCLV
jgi:hypothetical protein